MSNRSTHRSKLIAANWKMNLTKETATLLIKEILSGLSATNINNKEILICPSFTLLSHATSLLQNTIIKLGAQDCHFAEKGAYTGDISAAMLNDIGIKNVILGHSERRLFHKETDLEICNKVQAAHKSGLNVILCIGETKEEKDKGLTLSVLKNQIDNSLNCDFNAENTVIAYEPVWAIGTSLTPTIEEIQSTHLAIRKHIDSKNQNTANNIKILYGGSLKASNAKDILSLEDVDGGLIGGASLIASEFLSIINS